MPAQSKAEDPIKEDLKPLFETARKMFLAGIGAIALAQDEIEEFVTRLVERGEIAERDGKKIIHEAIEHRKKDAQKAEDEFSKRVEKILDQMNVSNKADIEALGEKIAALSKKLDELKKAQQ